jgi:sulfhydrogenase subunit beta (sulfur reductase)
VTHENGESTIRKVFLSKEAFPALFDVLHQLGYEVIGPTIDQDAIVYDRIHSVDDLPRGWTDIQQPGKYRLQKRDDDALFGYVVGPHSWKQYLFPSRVVLTEATCSEDGWSFNQVQENPPKLAFLGVRACELAAMRIQDRVFIGGPYVDPIYQQRRANSIVIAVNCTQAATTCFCTSMNTGPRCMSGFDLALTELPDGFVVESVNSLGHSIVEGLETAIADEEKQRAAEAAIQQAVDQITKRMDTSGIRDLLMSNLENLRWDDVATRCLSCTNCTMVCPTCFCSSVDEVSNLSGDHVERQRQWDSCFNINFSYMNGGIVREKTRDQYRQWITHKLATWYDQFGTSGCVGCGRCITWCPVGIDLTEEVAAIRGSSS